MRRLPVMPVSGSVGGCVRSTKCGIGALHATPLTICMVSWVWSNSSCATATFRGRKHEPLSESRMREICTSGSMSGRWKRGMVPLVRHRQTKGPDTDRQNVNHRATSRLYTMREPDPRQKNHWLQTIRSRGDDSTGGATNRHYHHPERQTPNRQHSLTCLRDRALTCQTAIRRPNKAPTEPSGRPQGKTITHRTPAF